MAQSTPGKPRLIPLAETFLSFSVACSPVIQTRKMTYLASTAIPSLGSYTEIEFINVPGQVTKGEYAEFIVDQDGLMEVMLDLFYIKVD